VLPIYMKLFLSWYSYSVY